MGPKMERQISVHRSEVDTQQVSQIIESGLDNLPPISSRTIKVFLSSTFSDMIQERNALMEHTYPKLKTLCRDKYGLEFQMMDLRWGIRDESQDDHTTIDFCLREIVNCRQQSVGPCFVAFLGQKYGYRPFPPNIKADEFEKLYKASEAAGKESHHLDRWYKKDENVKPAMYNLQPISSVLVHYNDKSQPKLQEKDQEEWNRTFKTLQTLLRDAAERCYEEGLIDVRVRDKYYVSVTEYEIYHGMMRHPQPDISRTCMILFRNIRNLDDNLSLRRAQKFTDVIPGTHTVDQEARALLDALKFKKLPQLLRETKCKIDELSVDWEDKDNDPSDNKQYLEEFCSKFYQQMEGLINRCAKQADQLNRDPYVVEVIQHLTMCKSRVEVFRGRHDIISEIKKYVTGTCRDPMVLYGLSGSGKTSVIAKAYSQVTKWLPKTRPANMLRFLGTTARSTSMRLILGCLCWQIDVMYGRPVDSIPSDYPGLVNYFHEALQTATEERPLVLFLDSLDQLSPSHNAHDLTWLPKHLPPNVRIIVSTLQFEYDILETLRSTVSNKNRFVEVQPLGLDLSTEIIEDWLQGSNRTLTVKQYNVVKEALSKCSLPLYTRLIFDKMCTWKSYSPVNQTQLEPNVKGVINKLFDTVEKYHGQTFTKHALSYLTASKSGLSDAEMEDVLSLDDEVLNDVFTYWLPPVRRIPPLLWPRLQHELDRYIIQRESNGMIVYFWYHRQFNKVVMERYLDRMERGGQSQPSGHTLYIHSMLAHYYQGTWGGGIKKAFKYTQLQAGMLGLDKLENEADRMCPEQPLIFDTQPDQPKRLRFNLRTLSELPYHLAKSYCNIDLKRKVLFNYKWLHTKLEAMSLHDVLQDFAYALEMRKDIETEILCACLRIAGANIQDTPGALSFELMGRLLPYYEQHANIRALLQQCDTTALKNNHLVPVYQCFEAPKGMLKYILEEHLTNALDLKFSRYSKELISVAKDGTIAFWNMTTGELNRMISLPQLSGAQIGLLQSADGKYLLVESDKLESPVFVYSMRTAELKYKVGKRSPQQRRCFVVGNILIRQKTIYDIPSGDTIGRLDDYVNSDSSNGFLPCDITPNGKYILIAQKTTLSQYELRSKKICMKFISDNTPHSFAITPDSKYCYTGYDKDCLFKVLDIDPKSKHFGSTVYKFDYSQHSNGSTGTMTGFMRRDATTQRFPTMRFSNELTSIHISPVNQKDVLINIRRGVLIILHVSEHKHTYLDMARVMQGRAEQGNRGIQYCCYSSDARYVLAAISSFLCVWNSEDGSLATMINIHSVDGFPITVSRSTNLVATGSSLSAAIKVWDLNKLKMCDGAQMEGYTSPVDMMVGSHDQRLLFVRRRHKSTTYRFSDYFGVDVWNMSTNTTMPCLDYNQYGELLQMEASRCGQLLAMLIKIRNARYVIVINFKLGKCVAEISQPECHRFVVSPNWDWVCTESYYVCGDGERIPEVRLWSVIDSGFAVWASFEQATCPVFSHDSKVLMYIEKNKCIEVYSILSRQCINHLFGEVDIIQAVPNMPGHVLATRLPSLAARKASNAFLCSPEPFTDLVYHSVEEGARPTIAPDTSRQSTCTLWCVMDESKQATLSKVAPNGIVDLSKDGRFCIDGYLQVFCVKTGKLLNNLSGSDEFVYKLVKLTYDGQFAIWANESENYVKAARVLDNRPVGYVRTHEKPRSIVVMEFGYMVVIGREDGNLLTMKLVTGQGDVLGTYTEHATVKHRTSTLLQCNYPDGLINTFDINHRVQISPIVDDALPKIHKDIHARIYERQKVPHAIIKTNSADSLKEMDHWRSSSPAHGCKSRSKETSPASSQPGSPATLPRSKKKLHLLEQDSNSNLLPASFVKDKTFTLPGRKHHQKEKSKPKTELFTPKKALQNIGSAIFTVTDMAPQRTIRQCQNKSDSSLTSLNGTYSLSSDSSANSSPSGTLHKQRKRGSKGGSEGEGEHGEYRKEVGRSRFYSQTDIVAELEKSLQLNVQ